MSVYLDLTREFNQGGSRAILSSGQAVVLHRLAVMSKDGDWIVRETPEALAHVRSVLGGRGAKYRYGAPLDHRWMEGGWSAHCGFRLGALRVRTDFVTRPPRLAASDLRSLWVEQEGAEVPYVDARRLVALKKTNREKDYAVIGELARRLVDPQERLLASRSARDIEALCSAQPDLAHALVAERPLLALASKGMAALERALDEERRALMHANEARLSRYMRAAEAWEAEWPSVDRAISGLPLPEAHEIVVSRATNVLPFHLPPESA